MPPSLRSIRWSSSWVVLIAAVVFGGLAVFAASSYISQTVRAEKARLAPNVESMDVVVAKADLERGDIVGADNMAVRKVPKEFVPGTAVDPTIFGNVEGARLAVPMRRGEILLRGILEGADTATFSTKVLKGVRAITLSVDEVNSLSGLLQPNDHVDLFYTAKPLRGGRPDGSAPDRTQVLMQNVLILATGRQVRPTIADGGQPGVGRAFTTITIEATPEDTQRLILAQKAGSLTAVLRGPLDSKPITADAMDVSSLFGQSKRLKNAVDTRVFTEIIVGGTGRVERELLPVASVPRAQDERAAPTAAPPAFAPASAPTASDAVREFIKATTPPSEPITMSR